MPRVKRQELDTLLTDEDMIRHENKQAEYKERHSRQSYPMRDLPSFKVLQEIGRHLVSRTDDRKGRN